LPVGGVALLARDAKGAWTRRDECNLNRELSKLYGVPLDFGRMRRRVDAIAAALENGDLAGRRWSLCARRLSERTTPKAWRGCTRSKPRCVRFRAERERPAPPLLRHQTGYDWRRSLRRTSIVWSPGDIAEKRSASLAEVLSFVQQANPDISITSVRTSNWRAALDKSANADVIEVEL
jgi:hypothetical protein